MINNPLPDQVMEEKENDYLSHYDVEPTDDEMMSSFGTKWHDGL